MTGLPISRAVFERALAMANAQLAVIIQENRAMGGGWKHPTGSKFIRVAVWESKTTAVSYGEAGWPSQSYRLWAFEAE